MAINIVHVGTPATIVNSTANKIQWNLSPAPTAGNAIIIVWTLENPAGTTTGTSITCIDNQIQNTYQTVALSPNASGVSGLGGLNAGIFYCPSVNSSGTFTVTINATASNQTVTVNHIEVNGIANVDIASTFSSGSSVILNPVITNSIVNANANDLVVAVLSGHKTTATGVSDPPSLITGDNNVITGDNNVITGDRVTLFTSIMNNLLSSLSNYAVSDAGFKIVSAIEISSASWLYTTNTGLATAAIASFVGGTAAIPGQVIGLSGIELTATNINLSWTALSTATSYTIIRNGTIIAMNVVLTTYSDIGLVPLTNYTYTVVGVNLVGTGTPSSPITILTSNTLNVSGPISLGGSIVGQSIELQLGESGTLPISLNDSNTRQLVGISSGQISFLNFYGNGTESPVAPGQVTGLSTTAVSSTAINLSWSTTPNAISYIIKRGTTIIASNITAIIYADTGLTPLTSYTYTVAAVNSIGTGPFSIASSTTTLSSGTVSTPTFSPIAGTYSSTQTVTISCSTPSSSIYYTTNGTTPTTSSTVYSGPITVSTNETIHAIAIASGFLQSAVGNAPYVISSGATLLFNYPNFTGATGITAVSTGNAGGISGSTLWVLNEGAGHADGCAWRTGLLPVGPFTTQFTFQFPTSGGPPAPTQVMGGTFSIQNSTAPPGDSGFVGQHAIGDANVAGIGLYNKSGQVNEMTPGVSIKFDMNGANGQNWYINTPNSTGLYLNGGPFSGLCPAEDLQPSGINLYNGNLLSCTIVYDGSLVVMTLLDTVTNNQSRHSWPLNLSAVVGSQAYYGFTVGAVGTNTGMAVQSWALYSGYNTRLAVPTFSLSSGQYSGTQSLSINGPVGSSIYYTTNGLQPTSSSTLYTGSISINSNQVIQAVAIQSGLTDSLVAVGTYQINTSNLINFTSGFTAGNGVVLNGRAILSGSSIQLTDTNSIGQEVGSAWWGAPVTFSSLITNFQMQITSPAGQGMCFVLQNFPSSSVDQGTTQAWKTNGPTAMGGSGSSMGYGGNNASSAGSPGIPNSVALGFQVCDSSGAATSIVGVFTNGASPGLSTGTNINTGANAVNLHSGNPFNVQVSYNQSTTTLSFSITDTVTGKTFSTTFSVDIQAAIGSTTAYVGFTAATGGSGLSNQLIKTWTYTSLVATPTFSPVAGSYASPQAVTISCSTPNSAIYYTTDGTTPTFPITGTTKLYTSAIIV